jgi:hypothetical protein
MPKGLRNVTTTMRDTVRTASNAGRTYLDLIYQS